MKNSFLIKKNSRHSNSYGIKKKRMISGEKNPLYLKISHSYLVASRKTLQFSLNALFNIAVAC